MSEHKKKVTAGEAGHFKKPKIKRAVSRRTRKPKLMVVVSSK
jgi:hypothetical protein